MRFKYWILFGSLLYTAESFAGLAAIWLQKKMIDRVLLAGIYEDFVKVLIGIGAAYLLQVVLHTIGAYINFSTAAKIKRWLSIKMMQSMHRLPVGVLQKERIAKYVYHFTKDAQEGSQFLGNMIPRFVQRVATAIVLVWLIAQASFVLLIAMFVFTCVYIMIGRRFAAKLKKASSEVNQNQSNLLVHLEEGVSSTREVLAFRREGWEGKRYNNLFNSYYTSAMNEAKLSNKQMLVSDPLKWGPALATFVIGGWMVLGGRMSLGTFVVTYQFSLNFMEAINLILLIWMQVASKLVSIERIRSVMDGPAIHEGTKPLQVPIRKLYLKNVHFQYDENKQGRHVLSDVHMDLSIGKKIAIVGTSGGGKSTIASLLIRLFEPTTGEILVNGEVLENISRSDWSQKVVAVFQEPYLFPDTIRMNLLLGLTGISEERIEEVCRAMHIHDFIIRQKDGYETTIGERGITLSGGQRQRLALARAMLFNPEILILDEATSSLDLEMEREIQHELDSRRKGKTTIIIAHRLSTIRNADIIYVLDRGIVAEQGTHDELMEHASIYQTLVYRQVEENKGVGA
jgi:ABC-type multidrug transport system fused ATPase/permease subunit